MYYSKSSYNKWTYVCGSLQPYISSINFFPRMYTHTARKQLLFSFVFANYYSTIIHIKLRSLTPSFFYLVLVDLQ